MTARDDDPRVQSLLASLREEPADDGASFAAQLHLRLSQAGVPAEPGARARLAAWLRERPWLVGSLSGATAGVAAFALASALAGGPREPAGAQALAAASAARPASGSASAPAACPPVAPNAAVASAEVFVVPVGKVAMVQLHFAVDRDIDEAEFSVLLPDGLAFFSEGEALPERSFSWTAPLTQGDNRVPVAVIGALPGRHRLAATATIAGEVVVHEIVLDVQGPA